jgi:opacity protein-like surface antigen
MIHHNPRFGTADESPDMWSLIMKKIVAFASAALAFGAQANAADLYTPEPAPQVVEQPVVAAANGWYLRGDVSYDIMNMKGAHYFRGSNADDANFDKAELDNTANIGVGVGYQVNDYFRVDKTFDYMFSTKFRGSTHGGGSEFGACQTRCVSTDIANFSAYSLLANAYVDIYKWGSFTPYVGFGLGGSYVKWDSLKNTSCDANNPGDCDDTVVHKGKNSWRFTYALMAGTSVDINCQFKADLGYRYKHIAGGNMFGYNLGGGPGSDKGFDIHEFRSGVRYQFGDACQTAYLPPAEIPSQPEPIFK